VSPRVSVVLPTRNRRDPLVRALGGVRSQRFRDFETLVVDDGSTDGTRSWLSSQEGIRVVESDGSGAAAARNRGVEQARGELIAFLDDDDVWQPGYLEAQVAQLDAHPGAALSYADHLEIQSDGRASRPDVEAILDYPSELVRLLAESFIHTLSVVVCRRRAFDDWGRFDESLTIVHDLDWYGRIAAAGGGLVHLPRTLVGRSVPGGLVTRHRSWFGEERTAIERALKAGGVPAGAGRLVRAYRSLYFARVGLAKADLGFGLRRLGEALLISPRWTTAITVRRLVRRWQFDAEAAGWDAQAVNPR